MKFLSTALAACLLLAGMSPHNASASLSTFFAIPDNLISGDIDIFLTSGSNTTGTVANTSGSFLQAFNIPANGTSVVTIPDSFRIVTSGVVNTNAAFEIVTDNAIAAYLMDVNVPVASNDMANLYPSTSLGTSYRLMAAQSNIVANGSQLTVYATQDSTTVTVIPTAPLTTGESANVPFNVTLNKGEAIMYTASAAGDLTGSTVDADKSIAVFGGHRCANVPGSDFACDHVIEQVFPVDDLGTDFVIVPTTRTTPGDEVRVLAHFDNTVVSYEDSGGTQTYNLNAGEYVVFNTVAFGNPAAQVAGFVVDEIASIQTNQPVLVGQYMTGAETQQDSSGDPAYAVIPSEAQWLDEYIFNVPTQYNDYLGIAIGAADLASLTIDGIGVNPALFSAVPGGGGLVAGNVPIADGSHLILANGDFMLLGHGLNTGFASYFSAAGSRTSGGGVEPPPGDDIPEPASVAVWTLLAAIGAVCCRKRFLCTQ